MPRQYCNHDLSIKHYMDEMVGDIYWRPDQQHHFEPTVKQMVKQITKNLERIKKDLTNIKPEKDDLNKYVPLAKKQRCIL